MSAKFRQRFGNTYIQFDKSSSAGLKSKTIVVQWDKDSEGWGFPLQRVPIVYYAIKV